MKGDGPLGRLFWRGVDVLGVLGPCRARALAAAALRVSARSGDRWLRSVYRAWAAAVGLDRLDLVKIDVEGDEPLVVEGMRESLRALRPRMLLVEVKAAVLRRSGRCEADLRDLLDACGYAPTGLVLHRNEVFRSASQHQAARTARPG